MEVEVNNPMVDQLMVNGAAQTPVSPNAKPAKDAETPDFDTMVHQKRAAGEKGEPKAQGRMKAETKETAQDEAEQKPVTDEQYAIAAAMMFQAQPDVRYTAIQTEAAEAVRAAAMPQQTLEAETAVELPEIGADAKAPVDAVTVELPEMPVNANTAVELPQEPIRTTETPVEPQNEAFQPRTAQPEAPQISAEAQEPVIELVEAPVEVPVEASELPVSAETPVERIMETAPEAMETAVGTAELPETVEPQPAAEAPQRREAPAEARREGSTAEARPEAQEAERPAERPQQPIERAPRVTQTEPPRDEKTAEAPRIVRSEERAETADDDADPGAAQAQQGTPVFERVDAAPVKVAEVSKPIPLEAEDGVEQLGNELDSIVVNSADANRIEVTLTPENLGRLTVEVTRSEDGTLNVVLHATTEKAASLLEKGADGLRQVLAANAEREVQVQVRGNEEPQQQFLNPDDQNGREHQQQQQQQNRRQNDRRSAQDFLQQLRLGLVDVDGGND